MNRQDARDAKTEAQEGDEPQITQINADEAEVSRGGAEQRRGEPRAGRGAAARAESGIGLAS